MTIFRYALLRGIRSPLSLICNCILPIFIVVFPPFWRENGIGFGLGPFSLLMMVVMSGAYLMSQSILVDKSDGAIVRIMAAPITLRRYFAENVLSSMVPLVIQSMLVSVLGFILHDWTAALSFAVFLCYTVLTIASITMSFAWHSLFLSNDKESSGAGFVTLLLLVAMVGGLTFPVEAFPGPLEYVGAIFPPYWAVRAMTNVLDVGYISGNFGLDIGVMLLFSVAYLLYGGSRKIQ
ncbi:MAG: ABC transporter permease [Lachnospiraceae bacterium]|nr:ABC transporter permease [Lachnospiraceae bacterium]